MIIPLPDGEVDTATGRVLRGGVETVLTSRERGLLAHLAARAGQVVPTEELLREVWGVAPTVVTRAVFHTMRRLRARIELDPASPRLLLAEHGIGYRFVPWQEGPAKLVGRDAELRRIGEALRIPASPLFLVGPPGVGKSALVRAACEAHPNPVLVDLEGVGRMEEVYERLAVALGLAGLGDLVDRVDHALAGRALVALDGAEGVLSPLLDALSRWCRTAPRAALLVGSRVRPGEHASLPLRVVPIDPLGPADARRMLVARLDRVGVPVASDDPGIDPLVAATAGLPLALHLAATEARYVPLVDVGARLLEPGSLDPLRATVTRSLSRLPPDVRGELLRIVRFARAAHRADLLAVGVTDRGLRTLIDHGLVLRADRGGRASDLVDVYAVLRAAVEAAADPSERLDADHAHAAHFAQLGAPTHLAHLDDDRGHRRPALYDALPELTRALDRTAAGDPLRPRLYAAIATARAAFGGFRGVAGGLRAEIDAAPAEARAAFLGFLANLDTAAALDLDAADLHALPAAPELRPFLASHAWAAHMCRAAFAPAREAALRGREQALALGWRGLAGRLATQAASSERQLQHPDDATALTRLAAADGEAVGDLLGVGEARNLEGIVWMETGQLGRAEAAFADADAEAVRGGSTRLRTLVLGNQGILARMAGDEPTATVRLGQALHAAVEAGDRLSEARVRLNLAVSLSALDRHADALHELDVARRLGDALGVSRMTGAIEANEVLFLLNAGDWRGAAALREPTSAPGGLATLRSACIVAARCATGAATLPDLLAAVDRASADPPELRAWSAGWCAAAAWRRGWVDAANVLLAQAQAIAEDRSVPPSVRLWLDRVPTIAAGPPPPARFSP